MKSGALQIEEEKEETLQALGRASFILHIFQRAAPGGFTLIFTWCKPCSQLPGSSFSGVGCDRSWKMRLDKTLATTLSHQSFLFKKKKKTSLWLRGSFACGFPSNCLAPALCKRAVAGAVL